MPPVLGLLLLSALWALGSLRSDLFPEFGAHPLTPDQADAVLFCAFAVVAAFIAVARHAEFPRGSRAWANAGIGLGLFVVPAALVAWAQGELSALDRVAIFSLTPVFAVVLEPHLQGNDPKPGKAALGATLAAVSGVLCLFPLQIPGSLRAGLALLALLTASFCIAAANCVAVRLALHTADRSILPLAAQAAGAAGICFVASALFAPHGNWQWSELAPQFLGLLIFDLPALFLLFWMMRRLAASRMTARFLLAPLITIVAGMALQAPLLSARAWFGIALLAGGAGWLAFSPAERSDLEGLNLRSALTADSSRRRPPDG